MNARAVSVIVFFMAGAAALAQPNLYVSPDVPTTPDGTTYFPWQVVAHQVGGAPFALDRSVPGNPTIDAVHRMDDPGSWLFSFDAPTDLAGALAAVAEPRDAALLDGGVYSLFFDGSCASPAVPLGSDLDAIHLDGNDDGDLIVSFDVPTTLGAIHLQPDQLGRYERTGAIPCGWTFSGVAADFGFGTHYPGSANVTGVGRAGGQWILSLEVPTDVGPPGPVTRLPGQIVATNGVTWTLFEDLQTSGAPGWPVSSVVEALSCAGNPGRIVGDDQPITMQKNLPDVTIVCPGGCSSGGESYGLYEGTLGSLLAGAYDHTKTSCLESCPGGITFSPSSGDAYYLVVPHNMVEEGSYGLDSSLSERPQAASVDDRCLVLQNLTPCP